jgi:hypothetical protein
MRRTWTDTLPEGVLQVVWDSLSLDECSGYHQLRQRCTASLKSTNQFRQVIREIAESVGSIRVRGLPVCRYPVGLMARVVCVVSSIFLDPPSPQSACFSKILHNLIDSGVINHNGLKKTNPTHEPYLANEQ